MPETKSEKKRLIVEDLDENKEYLNDKLGIGVSFDVGVHEFTVGRTRILLYYINGFASDNIITQVLRDLNDLRERELPADVFEHLYHRYIPYFQMAKVATANEFIDKLLVGQVGLVIEGSHNAIIMDAKVLPTRSPEEPDTERIVRGAHDGFTETLVLNTVLTRRRIRDERLRFEIMQIGERTKTDVAIAYIKGVANTELIDKLKHLLQNIQIDGIPMAEKTVEEFIIGKTFNPFPLVRYTERPDVAAVHLLEGHVLIYVDTSPSVMITAGHVFSPCTARRRIQTDPRRWSVPSLGAFLWHLCFGIFAPRLAVVGHASIAHPRTAAFHRDQGQREHTAAGTIFDGGGWT